MARLWHNTLARCSRAVPAFIAALALLPALCLGQRPPSLDGDAFIAASHQRTIDDLQARQNKGLISRETALREIAGYQIKLKRLRDPYVGTPYLKIFDQTAAAYVAQARGEHYELPDRDPAPEPRRAWKDRLRGFASEHGLTRWLWETAQDNPVTFILGGIIVLCLLVYVIASWPEIMKQPEPEPDRAPPLTRNYGSADFAPVQYELPAHDWFQDGVFLGQSSEPEPEFGEDAGAPVYSSPEHRVLIIGRTRVGKGTRIIIPTLARNANSMLVIDPKGENAAVTARARRDYGQKVHILNPWGVLDEHFRARQFAPASYNPLDVLGRADPNAVAIAQGLAGAICPRERGGKDSYWTESAAGLLTAVLLWLADQPGESKTLARAREIVTAPKKKLDEYLALMAASKAFGGAIAEHAGPFIGLAPETYSGVISNLARHTQFLSDPRVKASTASSTFPMADLAEGTTLYVVIPPERMDSQRTWLRLLITAGMQTFKHVKRRAGHRCMFLVDEFPALGHLEELPRDIATMSGYGVDFTLIVQGLDQLKAVYGDSAETIINNCAYKWFCGVSDLTTSKYLSDTLGQKTVRTISKSASEGKSAPLAGRGARENESESTTWGEMGRKLLTPDEVMNLGRGAAILLHPYTRPHYLKPVDYWRLETAFGMYRQQRPALYWDPPLALDENPYHAAGDAART